MTDPTTRAYTLKLSGDGQWRDLLWNTHVAVNRAAWTWGDWLLTLRGGLPAYLADNCADRRVLLALSWLSVESPKSLAPAEHVVALGSQPAKERSERVKERFSALLEKLQIPNAPEWVEAAEPALTARIRDDAVWVDRAACFAELQKRCPGLDGSWAERTLFDFLGGEDDYFRLPDADASDADARADESKEFAQKAGGWLSRNWGAGEKSDASAIADRLSILAGVGADRTVGRTGAEAVAALLVELGQSPSDTADVQSLFEQLKRAIGWKGRPSKGWLALEQIRDADVVTPDLWRRTTEKLGEEVAGKSSQAEKRSDRPQWMQKWRAEMETRLGVPYRAGKDLIWEHGVALDHALRRVSAAHTWIKRAECKRLKFRQDAAKIDGVPQAARAWLDAFREWRSDASAAVGDYLIQPRAIDGWERIVQAWAKLESDATRRRRIEAVREIQANLDDDEKFGDIQLFAGFGDDESDSPQPCLADDEATCVWRTADGRANPEILKAYVCATVAEHDQGRFKVPACRHPDPLRHPVFVDYGNSRWGVSYSALEAARRRRKDAEKLADAKSQASRAKLQAKLDAEPDLRGVALDVWNGERVESLPLRWFGGRLWNDLDLDHFSKPASAATVSRADRLGRAVADASCSDAVHVAEIFEQKDWNGRLQAPRAQLERIADLVYGKEGGRRLDPDFSKLDRPYDEEKARKRLAELNWFLTTSAKLQPRGPWLDYVRAGLPDGVAYKKGRNGWFVDYAANKGRKSRARLQLARLPGLRVLSFDLGHRYAAACAVWETLSREQMLKACREADCAEPDENALYVHLPRPTNKLQKSGPNKGKPVRETVVYRRIGPDRLPDGAFHPAPWARLERQFLIKLQGEDRPARRACPEEIAQANQFRDFLGLRPLADVPRIDDLQRALVREARLGLRRLADAARIAFAMTAVKRPVMGGRMVELTSEQRVEYVLDALVRWQGLAGSNRWSDEAAAELWRKWIEQDLGGPPRVAVDDEARASDRKKQIEATREALKPVAEKLADPTSEAARELHRLWSQEWTKREKEWRAQLRWLRRFLLPRASDRKANPRRIRNVGGLSTKRLQTIRDLYQTLKAFRMRAEPGDLRKNVPTLGDESLANFGRRILDQLERLREQRVKQLASRIVEAALGVGRVQRLPGPDRRRPRGRVDPPCHAVVAENLKHYRPEESRLRRENRRIMDWAARNVRKYIVEGCELHGLRFAEVSPAFTSRQDSRTGAPGIRCEDVSEDVLRRAVEGGAGDADTETASERKVRYWRSEIRRVEKRKSAGETLNGRDAVLAAAAARLREGEAVGRLVRLPRRGGELFVSADARSPAAAGLQADLNAAANIGLRALTDPDWFGAWWYILVDVSTAVPVAEKVEGCPLWKSPAPLWKVDPQAQAATKAERRKGSKSSRTSVYAFSWRFSPGSASAEWWTTTPYWHQVEKIVSESLKERIERIQTPF